MEIHVSRMLFTGGGFDENNPAAMNTRQYHGMPISESVTPVRQESHEQVMCRANLSTPRPIKESSPTNNSGEEEICTPTEPNAPVKEKCKSDPRQGSMELKHSNVDGKRANKKKIFSDPDAKCLVFEDEKSLAPLEKSARKHLRSAGTNPSKKSKTREKSKGKDLDTQTPRKGTLAWENKDEKTVWCYFHYIHTCMQSSYHTALYMLSYSLSGHQFL